MRLVDNWKRVLLRAWSIWIMVFAIVMDVALQVVPFMEDIPRWLILAVLLLGILARLIRQDKLHDE